MATITATGPVAQINAVRPGSTLDVTPRTGVGFSDTVVTLTHCGYNLMDLVGTFGGVGYIEHKYVEPLSAGQQSVSVTIPALGGVNTLFTNGIEDITVTGTQSVQGLADRVAAIEAFMKI